MQDTEKIGRNVKILREATGATRRRFAEIVGITYSMLTSIETGRRMPSMGTLERIASAFHTTSSVLMGEILDEKLIYKAPRGGGHKKKEERPINIDRPSYEDGMKLLGKFLESSRPMRAAVVGLMWKDTSLVPKDLVELAQFLQASQQAK